MVEFDCPHCARHYSVDKAVVGRAVRCKTCKGFMTVPPPGEAAQPRELTPAEQVMFFRHLQQAADERSLQVEQKYRQTQELAQALYRKYKELRADFDAREGFIQGEEARLEVSQNQLAKLTREIAALLHRRGELRARLSDASRDVKRLTEERDEARQALESAKASLAEARAEATASDALRQEVALLRTELAEAQAEVRRLHDQLASVAEEPRMALAKLESLERENAWLAEAYRTEREAQARADEERRQAVIEAAALRDRVGELEAAEQRRQLESKPDSMPNPLEAELTAVRAQLFDAESRLATANQALEQALVARGEAAGRLVEQQRTVERLSAEVEAMHAAEAEAAERWRLAEQRAAHADVLRVDRDESRAQLREAEMQAERLRAQLARTGNEGDLEAVQAAADAAREIERLTAELTVHRETRAEAERALQAALARAEQAETAVEVARAELHELRVRAEHVARLETALDSEHERVQDMARVAERLVAELCESTRVRGAVEARLDERSQFLEQVNGLLRAERSALERAQVERRHAEEEASRLREELASVRAQVESAESRLAEAQRAAADAQKRAAEAKERAAEAVAASAPPVVGVATVDGVDDGLTLIPELVDGAMAGDPAMMETLLRFIEPET